MILIGFRLPIPLLCDRHTNCEQADAWAARFRRKVEHPNQRLGRVRPYGRPACSVPGCTRLVFEWGRGHEGHVAATITSDTIRLVEYDSEAPAMPPDQVFVAKGPLLPKKTDRS